jgi:Protein of unknown function (DUF3892)
LTTYTVKRVRKERSADGSHQHIAGVCTTDNRHYTRLAVVDSINAGNTWETSAGGFTATILTIRYCPRSGCLASPYLKTNPNSNELDNLENLPKC